MNTDLTKFATTPVVETLERRQLLMLMAEFFGWLGYSEIKARLPNFAPPAMLSGTLEDHRPDLTCRQSDARQTALLLEVVPSEALLDPRLEHRWTLLFSASRLYSAELHFVLPSWNALGACDQLLRRRLERLEIVPQKLWMV